MRVVFVGGFGMAPKSTMRARALPLARTLAASGHDVTILLPPWDNPADSGRRWTANGVTVVNVRLPVRFPLAWYPWLGLRLLRATLALRPDVVHVFKPKGFSGFVAQALLTLQARGWLTGLRVVVDTDDWEAAWNDMEPYPGWQKALFSYQERWLLRRAPALTVASLALGQVAEAERGSREGVLYLPNGAAPWPRPSADRVAALRRRLGLAPELAVLLLYTRFVECPAERFVRLLAGVASKGVRPAVLLVGAGLRGEEAAFRRAYDAAGLGMPLVAPGWVDAGDLPEYLALADAALFPMADTPINRTKCSVKLIDLLSAGVPVVAEAVGQNCAYIEDGMTGLLTPPDDDHSLAAAVAGLLKDRTAAETLGNAARVRMQREFGWSKLGAVLPDVYGR